MGRREIVITYVVIVLFIVIGIGYAYLEEDLSLQNNVTLTNYSAKPPVCIKATTLHTEKCNSSSSSGCRAKGYSSGATITYGHTEGSTLTSGYALTCDVNGDGTYNETTERFYYVSDFYDTNLSTPAFNEDYVTLIYYKNYGSSAVKYNSSGYNYQGPTTLRSSLPTSGSSGTWKNISLVNEQRQILNESGGTTVIDGTTHNLPKFSYAGYAARLLTTQELSKACNNITVGSQATGELDSCEFLMEDSSYSKSSGCSGGSCHYWLETPYATSGAASKGLVWVVYGSGRNVGLNYANITYGSRPAVDILKSDISLK